MRKNFSDEPIAIIGIGCRFPGEASNPINFWNLIARGTDATVEVPANRWNLDWFYDSDPKVAGKMYVRSAGFLRQPIDQFDAAFFGISPREAEYLDPQQRLLLEVTWEAMEDAGLDPSRLAGSNTGVYIGGFMLDNMLTQFSPLNKKYIGQYSAVSSSMTILSNRLSYTFDLRGASITMDTACSSSLVALHQACQAIWRNENALALVGGVNIMYRPETFIAMCKGGFLSPDGRCKSFDARANGYGRGEGAGIVVLKHLSAAIKDGDAIYALICGTGSNQDGRTDGISVPSPVAQQALIREVCEQSQIDPRSIRYVEAHGTGTTVGDPIEASALGAVIGKGRTGKDACVIGSVKANIGHLEAASGIASVIKLVLCLTNKQIPPLANLETPNPNIPFEQLGLRLPLHLESMPEGDGPTYVSVNSFGYGGTNAHAILREAPSQDISALHREVKKNGFYLLPLSARSKSALRELATAYGALLENTISVNGNGNKLRLQDICYSASLRRGHYEQRLALAADSAETMNEALHAFLANEQGKNVATGAGVFKNQKPVFVFTGMGPQWWAMGRELLERDPEFQRVTEQCDALFQQVAGWSILAEMKADRERSRMTETQIAQPANFIVQAGLAALWRSWGVEPAAIIGHSVGEVAAAYVAGVLDLESAIRVVYHRSRVQKKAAGQGGMLAAGLSAEEAQVFLQQHEDISLAAINSPASITLAGNMKSLEHVAAALQGKGLFNRFLQVEVAYHSPYMEPLKPELIDALNEIKPQTPQYPLYSTVTGDRDEQGVYDSAYWARNMREPVYFAHAMDKLIRDGHRVFLEVGPHPVLSSAIKQCLSQCGVSGIALASLRREQPERQELFGTLAEMYAAGCPIDWHRLYPNGGTYVRLPTYPWQRETYWREDKNAHFDRLGNLEHPILGKRMALPYPSWKGSVSRYSLPYVADHQVENLTVLPGAAYVEIGLAVHRAIGGQQATVLENLEFHKALIIEPHQAPSLLVAFDGETRQYAVYSQQGEEESWTLHARGRSVLGTEEKAETFSPPTVQARMGEVIDAKEHYEDMRKRGLQYGPHFQGVRKLWRCPERGEILARVEGHDSLADGAHQHHLHPTLLDACFQALLASVDIQDDDNLYVPVQIRRVQLYRTVPNQLWCYGKQTQRQQDMIEGDISLFDENGEVIAELRGVRAQALTKKDRHSIDEIDRWLYQFDWQKAEGDENKAYTGRWLVFMDSHGLAKRLINELRNNGIKEIVCVQSGSEFWSDNTKYVIRPDRIADIERLLKETMTSKLDGIAYCWSLDAVATEDDPVRLDQVTTVITVIQAFAKVHQSHEAVPRFCVVTCNAECAYPQQNKYSLAQAAIIGLIRTAINEYTDLRFRAIDIDGSAMAPAWLANEMLSDSNEEETALRSGERYVPRLVRKTAQEFDDKLTEAPLFKADASYLITGGFGGFGLEVAKWMTAHGVRHLVLAGRSGANTPEAVKTLEMLRRMNVHVLEAKVDISNETQVKRLLLETIKEMPPLRGVFHAATVLDDIFIQHIDHARLRAVMRSKAVSAWYLHNHTIDFKLDYFVLFSSIASLLGSAGQASYVMANNYLDTLAYYRRAQNLAATSINWGALGQVGILSRHEQVQEYLTRYGFGLLTPKQAMKILEKILRWNPIELSPAIINWRTWGEFNPAWAVSPRYQHLMDDQESVSVRSLDASLIDRLASLTGEAREEAMLSILTNLTSTTLKLAPEKIDCSYSLLDLGMDSLLAMELQLAIEKMLGIKISILELMKGAGLLQLAQHLAMRINDVVSVSTSSPLQQAEQQPDIEHASQLLTDLPDLSNDEVDRLLTELTNKT